MWVGVFLPRQEGSTTPDGIGRRPSCPPRGDSEVCGHDARRGRVDLSRSLDHRRAQGAVARSLPSHAAPRLRPGSVLTATRMQHGHSAHYASARQQHHCSPHSPHAARRVGNTHTPGARSFIDGRLEELAWALGHPGPDLDPCLGRLWGSRNITRRRVKFTRCYTFYGYSIYYRGWQRADPGTASVLTQFVR